MPAITNWWKSLWNSLTGAGLTQAQVEANQFSSKEAQISRNWTEAMYNKYESPAAIRQQYEEAGLNPALMYEGYQPSGFGGAAAAPGSVSPDSPQLLSLLSFLTQAKLAKSEIEYKGKQGDLVEAQADQARSQAARNRAEEERTRMLTPAEYNDVLADVDLKRSGISRNEAESALAMANVGLLQIDEKTRDAYNNVLIAEKQAESARLGAETEKARAEIANLKREYVISFAREAAIKANTSLVSKQELNVLMEHNILYWNSESARYEANIKAFENDKKESNRVWRLVGEGAGILKDAGIAVGAVAAGAGRLAGSVAGSAFGSFVSTSTQ